MSDFQIIMPNDRQHEAKGAFKSFIENIVIDALSKVLEQFPYTKEKQEYTDSDGARKFLCCGKTTLNSLQNDGLITPRYIYSKPLYRIDELRAFLESNKAKNIFYND